MKRNNVEIDSWDTLLGLRYSASFAKRPLPSIGDRQAQVTLPSLNQWAAQQIQNIVPL
jgi:hypothetical protein